MLKPGQGEQAGHLFSKQICLGAFCLAPHKLAASWSWAYRDLISPKAETVEVSAVPGSSFKCSEAIKRQSAKLYTWPPTGTMSTAVAETRVKPERFHFQRSPLWGCLRAAPGLDRPGVSTSALIG